jgi:hypothetical protein
MIQSSFPSPQKKKKLRLPSNERLRLLFASARMYARMHARRALRARRGGQVFYSHPARGFNHSIHTVQLFFILPLAYVTYVHAYPGTVLLNPLYLQSIVYRLNWRGGEEASPPSPLLRVLFWVWGGTGLPRRPSLGVEAPVRIQIRDSMIGVLAHAPAAITVVPTVASLLARAAQQADGSRALRNASIHRYGYGDGSRGYCLESRPTRPTDDDSVATSAFGRLNPAVTSWIFQGVLDSPSRFYLLFL